MSWRVGREGSNRGREKKVREGEERERKKREERRKKGGKSVTSGCISTFFCVCGTDR